MILKGTPIWGCVDSKRASSPAQPVALAIAPNPKQTPHTTTHERRQDASIRLSLARFVAIAGMVLRLHGELRRRIFPMHSLVAAPRATQSRPSVRACFLALAACGASFCTTANLRGAETPKSPDGVKSAAAQSEAEMKPYTDVITHTEVTFDMVPIPGGKFLMGSPESEPGRKDDEGPQHEVEIKPFWMGKHEVTWDEYEIWMFSLDIQRRELSKIEPSPRD
jgi:hypothetical protein